LAGIIKQKCPTAPHFTGMGEKQRISIFESSRSWSRGSTLGASSIVTPNRDKIQQRFPGLELVWAYGGDNAWQVDAAVAEVPRRRLEIIKRSDDIKGSVVLPRRWVVERPFSWFGRTGASPRTSRTSWKP
jgi:transposase